MVDDTASFQRIEADRRLGSLEAGDDVSEESMSIHNEYSSFDDDVSPPQTDDRASFQLMVFPQPPNISNQQASVAEAIQLLRNDQSSQAVFRALPLACNWQSTCREISRIRSVEKIHMLSLVVQTQAKLIRQLQQENNDYHILAAQKSREIELLTNRLKKAEQTCSANQSQHKVPVEGLDLAEDMAPLQAGLPALQTKVDSLESQLYALNKVFLDYCASNNTKVRELRESITSKEDITDEILMAIQPLEQEIKDLKKDLPDVITGQKRPSQGGTEEEKR